MTRLHRYALCLGLLSTLTGLPATAQERGPVPVQTQRADGVPMQVGADWISAPIVPERIPLDARTRPVIRPWQPGDPIKEVPRLFHGDPNLLPAPPLNPVAQGLDPLAQLQQALGGNRAIDNFNVPVINQDGLPNTGVSPSDVNGDVGINHYILSINGGGGAQYIIYNKSDGSVAAGPFNMEGLGTGNCATGLGDAIILFDEMAQRWLLTEFTNGSNDLCLYVSSGSDPVNTVWSRYAFTPANNFPDYPKYGVWPDAYYLGTNQSFSGRPICALDRARMLAGLSATMQCFGVPTLAGFGFQVLQPLDHDGSAVPPAGANGTFLRHRDDEAHNVGSNNPTADFLELWELDINWTTPTSSTRIGPINITMAEFNSNLNGLSAFEAFPQPNGVRLDPLREPVMFRAAYRNFGSYESIVGNHVTDVDNADTGGIRWYELRRTGGTGSPWVKFQEGTYALADGGSPADRWMGAIAMDKSGNIGLGYSITRQSPGIFAGLRYVGRLAGDAPGVMTTSENLIVDGLGSQAAGNTRWGDYHSMSIDPVDGCTFWFAGNYLLANGAWNTRLASFRHFDCGDPEFLLDATNLSQQVCAVGPSTPLAPVTVTVAGRLGYVNPVTMSFGGGLPTGFSGSYTVNPVTPTGNTVANLNVSNAAAPGANAVTLRGSALGVDKDLLLTVQVSTLNPGVPSLSTPADGANGVAYRPVFSWAAVPQASGYVLEVATDSSFTNIVASATVAGTSHQFASNLTANTLHYWRVRAQNGCGTSANSSVRTFTTLPTPDQCPVGSTATNVFFDNIESNIVGWTLNPSSGSPNTRWTLSTARFFSPATSLKANNPASVTDQLATTPSIALPAGGSALTLQFQHYKGIEDNAGGTICYDGGRLEVSLNGGAFVAVPENQILIDPYTNTVASGFQNPLAGLRAWCGTVPFTLAVVDLVPYAGNNARFRFRFGSDNAVADDGWYVDDVKVQNCSAPAVATTTVLAATPDPSVFGQTVALTATVTSGSGTPTGNVQFLDGATPLGTVAVNGLGVATLNVSSLSVGAHTLNANYAGGGGFGASSDSEPQQVNKADTTTTITSDNPDPSVVGQAVAVNYTVIANAPGAGTPSGNVVVTVGGGAETCTGTVAAGTCSITLTSVGAPRVLTATYAGDANFNGSGDTENHTVNKAGTTTTINSDLPDPSVVGQAVAVNYSVVALAPGAGTPTGNVTVTVSGGAETCTGTVAAGTCSITLTSVGAPRVLTATYAGDASFNGSSDTENHTVNQAGTTTTITSDNPDPSTVGQAVSVNYAVVALAPGAGTPTGNVVVTVSGGAETCTGTVAAGTCSITLTSAGARTLTATYAGDASFTGSSDTEAHTVNGATTTTTITSDLPDPSVVGQAVAVNFTVTSGAGTPTGNVVVTVSGGAETCTGTVAAGTCSITLTSVGAPRVLTATYAGDANFNGSSDTEDHTVNKANSATTITSDLPDPSVVGQAVTVNYSVVAVAPGAGTPTGNVVVTVSGGAETCTGTVAAGTCSITLTSVGAPRVLTATYAGDASFNGSSDTEDHTVNKANSATTIASDLPDPSAVGQAVTVNYSVVAVAPGAGTPTGNVVVTVSGGAETCTGSVAAGTCSITLTSTGARTLTATYAGDANFNGSSDTEAHTVNTASTTTTITSDNPDPSTVGQAVAVNFTVTSAGGTPTGNVVVTVSGGAETCTGTVAAGTCNITLTSAGARTLTATYAGDSNFAGSADTEAHVVNTASTTTTITADTPDPSTVGQAVAVNFTVTSAGGTPTGNVVVTVSGGAETCTGTVAAGTCNITLTAAGARTLTATYAGDSNFAGSADTEAHVVNAASTTTTITADTPDPSTVGQAVTVNFTVTSAGGTPAGNVVVTVSGGAETCTGTVAAGTCNITLTSAGARTLTATYAGDSNFAGSSDTEAHVVNTASTTTTITADTPDPSTVGQAVAVNFAVTSAGGTPTGNVVVTVSGGAETCTGTVAAGTCNITLTAAGARTLTATYAGDSNFAGSADTEAHVVNAASTITTITSDNPDPSALGQAVTVNFTVTSAGGTPTGNVVVTVSGGAETCTGTVAAGTCNITLTAAGARTLTASYAGNSNFAGSSDTEPHVVSTASTTTTITADTPDPSVVGQAVAVNFTVTSAGGTPTGNVVVTVSGGAETCTGTVAAGTCSITLTSAGARTLTATYAGDANFAGSADTEAHVVNTASTITTITSDNPDPSALGQAVTVNFTVTSAGGTPTGNVVVTVSGGAETCTGTVAAGTCNITLTAAGARTLTASYAGNSNFAGSSDTEPHVVSTASTTTTITADTPDPSVVGQAVAVNFTVTSAGGTPTGNVVVTVSGGAETCTGTVAAGTCNITLTSAGARTLTATYAGDSNFAGSADTEAHVVNAASTTTTITSDTPDPSTVGQAVAVNFTVTSAGGTPTGNVVVTVSGGAETCTGTVAAGTCNITLTAAGARTLTATYAGDSNFAGSADTEAHVVNAASTTTTITSDNPDPSTVGQAVAVNFTVTSAGGTPTGNVVVTVSGGAETCTGTVAAGTCSITLTSAGTRTLTASYAGNSNFAGSSDTEPHVVSTASTTTTITADTPDPSAVGQAVAVTFTVTSAGGTPTGNVVVTVSGGAETCTGTVAAGTCSITLTSAGARTLTATYAGDGNFAGSSDGEAHTVNTSADLAVTKTNGRNNIPEGDSIDYVITVTNLGPSAVTGATLTDTPPATLGSVSWTCTATPPAACPAPSGSGAINQSVNLGVGHTLTYTLSATVVGTVGGTVANTAAIAVPAGVNDPVAANDAATDSDPIVPQVLLQDGFED